MFDRMVRLTQDHGPPFILCETCLTCVRRTIKLIKFIIECDALLFTHIIYKDHIMTSLLIRLGAIGLFTVQLDVQEIQLSREAP